MNAHKVPLEDRNVGYLRTLAAQEHIKVSDSATKEELIAAINLYRNLRAKSAEELKTEAAGKAINAGKIWKKEDLVKALAAK